MKKPLAKIFIIFIIWCGALFLFWFSFIFFPANEELIDKELICESIGGKKINKKKCSKVCSYYYAYCENPILHKEIKIDIKLK